MLVKIVWALLWKFYPQSKFYHCLKIYKKIDWQQRINKLPWLLFNMIEGTQILLTVQWIGSLDVQELWKIISMKRNNT